MQHKCKNLEKKIFWIKKKNQNSKQLYILETNNYKFLNKKNCKKIF